MALLPFLALGGLLLLLGGKGGSGSSGRRYWPVSTYRGTLSPFGAHRTRADGSERFHAGIDLGAFVGDDIIAVDDGEVISMVTGYSLGAGLEAVSVRHPGVDLIYAEIDATVKPGDRVHAGQVIGKVKKNGDGNSMLHLEAWETGTVPKAFTEWTPTYRPPGLLDVGEFVAALPHGETNGA